MSFCYANSRKLYKDKIQHSWKNHDYAQITVTEHVDDIMDLTNSVKENQMGVVLNDTEEIHIPHSAESSETNLLDGYDTEVVPDSEDDTTEPIFHKQSSRGIVSLSKRFVEDSNKVESPSHSQCKNLKSSDISTDVSDAGGHVSSQTAHLIVLEGNDGCPTTVHCSMKASGPNANDREMPKALVTCLSNNIEYSDPLGEEAKVDVCNRISKPKHIKQRDESIVYTRKRKRTVNFVAIDVEDVQRSPHETNEHARLSYIESQEPEDVSKALLFVDQYVVSNAVLSSPVTDFTLKDKSIFSQSANVARNLSRSAHRRNREEGKHIFEWDDRQDNIGPSDAFGMEINQTYVRMFSSERDMVSKDVRNLGDTWKDKTAEPFDMTQKNATMAVYKRINARVTEQMCDTEDWKNSKLPHQQVNEVSVVEVGKNCNESEYAFDVGVDTQMAAEGIQALAYATSVDCGEADADICDHNTLNKSFKGNQKRISAGSCSFPNRVGSSSKGSVSESEERGDVLKSKTASRSKVKKSYKKSGTSKYMNNATRVDFLHKKCVNEAKHVKMDGFKENLWPILSNQHSPCDKMQCRKKDCIIYPVAGNLKSLNMFSTNKGFTTESVDAKTDVLKVDSCNRRTRRSIVNTKNRSKPFVEKIKNTNHAMGEEAVDSIGVHKYDDGKIILKETGNFDADDKGRDKMLRVSGSLQNLSKLPCQDSNDVTNRRIDQRKTSYVPERPANWYCRDYPKGKRCKRMLGPPGGSLESGYFSLKVSIGRSCHPLRGQLNSEAFLSPSFSGFNIIKKRRSSTYVSPCWPSQKNSEKSLERCNGHELREIGNSGPKNTTYSKNLNENVNALQLGKTDNKHSCSTMDDRIKRTDSALELNNNAISEDARLPSNLIYKCNQHHGKKASTPSLTRELVRLGFRDSMPEITLSDSRKRKTMAKLRILLSKNLDERIRSQLKRILNRFGVSLASCPSNATHFIADKFARTRNMLEFVAQGKPVVTHMWLKSCQQAGFYIDETNYILRDMKSEQVLGFQLPFSLDQARKHPLLKGYRVIITPNTKPGQELLTSLVKAAHGQVIDLTDHRVIEEMDLNYLLIVSCEEDRAICLPFLERGKRAYDSELLLNGIIVQKLEFERHQLFMEE